MAIDWKKFENVFRLLAAVYAALGEEVFRGRFAEIAELYGPEATYYAIKSEWKDVSRLAARLARQNRQQSRIRPNPPIVPKRRRRQPAENIKAEPYNVIAIDDNDDDVQEVAPPSDRARVPPAGQRTFVKRKRADEAAPSDFRSHIPAVMSKRAKVETVHDTSDPNRNFPNFQGQPRYHASPSSLPNDAGPGASFFMTPPAGELEPLIFRSLTPAEVIPSSVNGINPAQSHQYQPTEAVPAKSRGHSQCQVSTTEHDRHQWEMAQRQQSPVVEDVEARKDTSRITPQAGPSRSRQDLQVQVENTIREGQVARRELITLSDSDDDGPNGNKATLGKLSVPTKLDKGKSRMLEQPYGFKAAQFSLPLVSYSDWEQGICYLCSVRFNTPMELRTHEGGQIHMQNLFDEASVRKGQERLEKYGLLRRSHTDSDRQFLNELETIVNNEIGHPPPTIIRGGDRALELVGSESHVRSSKIAVGSHRPNTKVHVTKPPKSDKISINAEVIVHTSAQMARVLRVNRFYRSSTIKEVLDILEHAGPSLGTTARPRATSISKPKPNIWIIDTEFAQLQKESGGRFDLSVCIMHLISGETILNHRLELPIPVANLAHIISQSNIWQAARQFKIHYGRQKPCNLPIITPQTLARVLKAAGFSPRDYIFVWHSSFVDYAVLLEFLARENLQHRLMPGRDNVIRVLRAWKDLLPGVPCGLADLFKLVFPKSELNRTHHFADVDTKKLGMMTFKLRELRYRA